MDPEFSLVLQRHVGERTRESVVVGRSVSNPFTRFQLDKRLRKYAGWAGLTDEVVGFKVHCHTLRHSGAREYLRQGILTVNDLQKMLGHRDLATTGIYLDTLAEEIGEKLDRKGGLKV